MRRTVGTHDHQLIRKSYHNDRGTNLDVMNGYPHFDALPKIRKPVHRVTGSKFSTISLVDVIHSMCQCLVCIC